MTSLASKLSTTNSAWNITQNRANDSKFLMFFEGKIWIVTANLFYFESISILNKNSSKCRYNLLKVDLRTLINFQNVELLLEMYMVISKKRSSNWYFGGRLSDIWERVDLTSATSKKANLIPSEN